MKEIAEEIARENADLYKRLDEMGPITPEEEYEHEQAEVERIERFRDF